MFAIYSNFFLRNRFTHKIEKKIKPFLRILFEMQIHLITETIFYKDLLIYLERVYRGKGKEEERK